MAGIGAPDRPVIEELLTTTRSVRRRLDVSRPVDPKVVVDCVRIALQAPNGSNRQGWRWIIVTDPDQRAVLAQLYRAGGQQYVAERLANAQSSAERRLFDSAQYLLDVIDQVPLLAIPCIEGRVEGLSPARLGGLYGSILPSVWSFMLALRTYGLGGAWTTFHLHHESEAAEVLGIPSNFTQVALLPVAHTIGDSFRPAPRVDVHEVVYLESWGAHLDPASRGC